MSFGRAESFQMIDLLERGVETQTMAKVVAEDVACQVNRVAEAGGLRLLWAMRRELLVYLERYNIKPWFLKALEDPFKEEILQVTAYLASRGYGDCWGSKEGVTEALRNLKVAAYKDKPKPEPNPPVVHGRCDKMCIRFVLYLCLKYQYCILV